MDKTELIDTAKWYKEYPVLNKIYTFYSGYNGYCVKVIDDVDAYYQDLLSANEVLQLSNAFSRLYDLMINKIDMEDNYYGLYK